MCNEMRWLSKQGETESGEFVEKVLTENKYLPKAYNHYTVKSITQQGLIRARERNRKAITVQYK